mgnify:CR=1 FL=1
MQEVLKLIKPAGLNWKFSMPSTPRHQEDAPKLRIAALTTYDGKYIHGSEIGWLAEDIKSLPARKEEEAMKTSLANLHGVPVGNVHLKGYRQEGNALIGDFTVWKQE